MPVTSSSLRVLCFTRSVELFQIFGVLRLVVIFLFFLWDLTCNAALGGRGLGTSAAGAGLNVK